MVVVAAMALIVFGGMYMLMKKTYSVSTTAALNTPVETIGFSTLVSHSTGYRWSMQLSDPAMLEIEHTSGQLIPQGLFDLGDPLNNMNYSIRANESAVLTQNEQVYIQFVCAQGTESNTEKARKVIKYTLEIHPDKTLTLLKRRVS